MDIPVRKMLVNPNKYGIKCPFDLDWEYVTIHNTYNDASAHNEIQYMINNTKEVSFHDAVDDIEIVTGIPHNRNAWAAGDGAKGKGNRKSLHIEICYSKSGGERYKKAEANTIKYTAQLLKERGFGIDRVKKHEDWSGKHCPHRILDEGRWRKFLNSINEELVKLNTPKKTIHFLTGGYAGSSLAEIHSYITTNNWWFNPAKNADGSITFTVGGFGEGTKAAVEFEDYLKEHNWWYEIR
jgi:N-acetylmuramoyl-L-alanine amidase